jgi:hypothetical protein
MHHYASIYSHGTFHIEDDSLIIERIDHDESDSAGYLLATHAQRIPIGMNVHNLLLCIIGDVCMQQQMTEQLIDLTGEEEEEEEELVIVR